MARQTPNLANSNLQGESQNEQLNVRSSSRRARALSLTPVHHSNREQPRPASEVAQRRPSAPKGGVLTDILSKGRRTPGACLLLPVSRRIAESPTTKVRL